MPPEPNPPRAVRLHVIHDLGGGSAKWLADFARADAASVNLVLRSFTHDDHAGGGVALYANPFDEEPLAAWTFREEIAAVAVAHEEYRAALHETLRAHGVGQIFVSSLIGHSLDALATDLPTVIVAHDYFPYCPSINLYFDGPCARCDDARMAECAEGNPRFNPFVDFGGAERARVRRRYLELIRRPNLLVTAPSRSVAENLRRLDPAFAGISIAEVPHGYGDPLATLAGPEPGAAERLRIVVLGQLSVAKGVELLKEAVDDITRFAELHLVGCRELGEMFRFLPHVHVLSHYRPDELAGHMASINPHVGVLASIVPETFSYALSELMMLGIPPLATRMGSFEARIEERVTGYLFEPDAGSLVAALRRIDADRAGLARVRANLRAHRERSPEAMVADYERIVSAAPAGARPPAPAGAMAGPASSQAVTVASMWKEVKRVNLQLAIVSEARAREHQQLERRATDAERALAERTYALLEREGQLLERERQVEHVSALLHARNLQLAELYRSTSWRLSAPVRVTGRALRRTRILARAIGTIARQPAALPGTLSSLARAWRDGGLHEVKKRLVALQPNEASRNAWIEYRERFARDVRPLLAARAARWSAGPLVSVIVPTYDTPQAMLREMLDSVLAQIYPRWELCIADDGSTAPHVRATLEDYARRDARIKLDFADANRGVSHASNRALAMATGEVVVLLDHDDVLEEQALFRVAECFAEDQPDMAYSDEVLVSGDGSDVRRLAYRPALSLEYLRSHPYIVHLVAFRRSLIEEIGGFDESLRISQDYDLILRAVEKSRRVAHIPEILYRWRLHEGSSGTARMREVMEVSRAVLSRHLERSKEVGRVEEGPGFNLFDVRRPLRQGLRVAILIPTKNRWELLRQCVESLRATIREVDYDIVVIDHESDEPATQRYLQSISAQVKIVPYRGAFNFSAINNFAVASLEGTYSHYLFCNNDVEAIAPGWLERMLELAQQPSIGAVGAKLYYSDRRSIQHAGVCVGAFGAAEHYGKWLRYPEEPVEPGFAELLLVSHEVGAVTAACMLMRKDAFEAVGGFDESIAVGFGDVDLCLRIAQKGYRVVFCPYAQLVHHESATRGTSAEDPHPHDSALYRLKWKDLLDAGDPYYSPGLSLTSTHWAPRQPLHCSDAIRRRIVVRETDGFERISFSPGA
jgi:GT2 family glycosyltransferase/glycosyltransferase involved in cell wall biosynthesis